MSQATPAISEARIAFAVGKTIEPGASSGNGQFPAEKYR
jgi:hypothetical protein